MEKAVNEDIVYLNRHYTTTLFLFAFMCSSCTSWMKSLCHFSPSLWQGREIRGVLHYDTGGGKWGNPRDSFSPFESTDATTLKHATKTVLIHHNRGRGLVQEEMKASSQEGGGCVIVLGATSHSAFAPFLLVVPCPLPSHPPAAGKYYLWLHTGCTE